MPSTMTQTCALCGLRYTNGALLELHIREDHVQRNRQAAASPEDAAGSRASQPDAGKSGSTAMAPRLTGSLQTVTAGTATTRPGRRRPGWLMAVLRRSARVVRQVWQAVRYANQELIRASEAVISFRHAPEPRRPLQTPTDNDARPASESTEHSQRAA